jgi:hypothetical protein
MAAAGVTNVAVNADTSTNAAQMNFDMAFPRMTIFEATANLGFCFQPLQRISKAGN